MTNTRTARQLIRTIATCLTAILWLFGSAWPSMASAETVTLQAITDFDNLDAGEVPFYRDTNSGRNVLAINAAIDEYRQRYAMATTAFTGTGGFYDLTLTTFGELDGDCIYQVLIDGVVVGAFVNTPAAIDYEVQQHTVEDIYVPAGATLGVTAVAVSNGLIPEHDAFAFARGRWQTLTLTSDSGGADFTPVVDLELDIAATNAANGDIDVSLAVSNLPIGTLDFTATSPVISVVVDDTLAFVASTDCNKLGYRVYCVLPEIAIGETHHAAFRVRAVESGMTALAGSVIADQRELLPADNLASTEFIADASGQGPSLGAALNSASASGGTGSAWLLIVLILLRYRRRVVLD